MKAQRWSIKVVLEDRPDEREAFFDAQEMQRQLTKSFDFDAGVSCKFISIKKHKTPVRRKRTTAR